MIAGNQFEKRVHLPQWFEGRRDVDQLLRVMDLDLGDEFDLAGGRLGQHAKLVYFAALLPNFAA